MNPVELLAMLAISTATTQPATQSDSAVDYLLNTSTAATAPSATTEPVASPFAPGKENADVRQGTITFSDGSVITGRIATTAGKLRFWDEQAGEYRDISIHSIKSMTAEVLWEKDEPQWRFKESGSDVKVETGKTYPARETTYRVTLIDGSTVTGGVVAPLMVNVDGKTTVVVLHKRDKGNEGQTLKELRYVKQMDF
ncbi:MAG: hypothetical protein JO353_02765 [Phycisphaerae bacterium]|nr:hypothetical protein [Phycisphaerae bacterium]